MGNRSNLVHKIVWIVVAVFAVVAAFDFLRVRYFLGKPKRYCPPPISSVFRRSAHLNPELKREAAKDCTP